MYGMFITYYPMVPYNLTPSRPLNREELFNLRHASARNVIERIFGIIKHRFHILLLPLEYCSLEVQSRIPASLAAIYNFIHINEEPDPDSSDASNEDPCGDKCPYQAGSSVAVVADAGGGDGGRDDLEARSMWDNLAQCMWDDYQLILSAHQDLLDDTESELDFDQ